MSDNPNPELPSLVVFADDWGRHPSSCQHLVRRLTDRWRILWVNTIGTRQVKADGFTFRRGIEKLKSWSRGLKQVSDQMWVLDPPMLPMISRTFSKVLNGRLVTMRIRLALGRCGMRDPVVLTTLPYTVWLLGDVGQRGLVYNCTDDYSHWPGADREALQVAERQIRGKANLVLAASHKLAELQASAARCEYFPHAVDFEHFAAVSRDVESLDIPAEIQRIPAPRIGYFGLIYEKLDFRLMTALATEIQGAQLVLIGPVDYCPTEFSALPNVHLVGRQDYAQLPRWLAGLDVLLMPYVTNDEMIRQSNPLKLRECLASGKPTVSIDVPEVRKLEPHVRVARDQADFVRLVREAVQRPSTPGEILARQRSVEAESWSRRADELHAYLSEVRGGIPENGRR